ncbi:hypothetical protein EMPS_07360 [Entomortierella parvispora]|uniref:F-box domain-containing protein n=1 Tax=Entomortierella parvispora TaxID=205924 RepID=A0A9P3HET1_9FUNG|nr:hypothetical protein EMPS_07360 [Entomortierella parvispora]
MTDLDAPIVEPVKTEPLVQNEPTIIRSKPGVPLEVWQRICDYLYPSQLIRLSKVSSLTQHAVCNLPVWSKVFALTHGEKSRLHLLPKLPDSQSYMYYMCAISPKVCEQCFKNCDFETDRPSAFPLPTIAPSQTRCTKDITYHGEPVDKTFTVHLCLECRREFFDIKPEPIPKDIVKKMDSYSNIIARYPDILEVPSIRDGVYSNSMNYSEVIFLTAARVLHGGDVGIIASRQTTEIQQAVTSRRLQQYVSSGN